MLMEQLTDHLEVQEWSSSLVGLRKAVAEVLRDRMGWERRCADKQQMLTGLLLRPPGLP